MRPLVRLGIRRRTTHAAHRLVTPLVVSRGSYATPPLEQLIINSSDWKSDNHYHRLGFHEEVRDTGRIKEHYRVLAKHFHPDSPTAPPDATEAFQNIKESYEYVLGAASNESSGRSQSEARSAFRFYDHERRQGQVRLLGEGVALFMVMTIGFILLVSRHNNSRLQARYLAHLVVIFFVIQLFPRLLAAAILYACHSNYLVNIAELTEQATASILFERRDEELFIRLEGVMEDIRKNVIIQVSCIDPADAVSVKCPLAAFTFGAGMLCVSVPFSGEEVLYRVKAVDMERGFVIADRTLRLQAPSNAIRRKVDAKV